MTCEGCASRVRRYLSREKGVLDVDVNLDSHEVHLTIDDALTSADKLLRSRVFTKPFRVRGWDGRWWREEYTAKLTSP